jgi:3-oxoacyl-(acyl-carrier-protein) synthase
MSRDVYIRAVVKLGAEDPDFREVITPMEARRMGRLFKRAVWCSSKALQEAHLEMPDAIITATDYGCMENSEAFLLGVLNPEEGAMSPTRFMQSTHNTIGSLIAIRMHCHGYNATYSHTGCSFRSALEDAMMQLQLGDIDSALVGWYDERTPAMDAMRLPGTEHAVAVVLSVNPK